MSTGAGRAQEPAAGKYEIIMKLIDKDTGK
jgi:hypothetical protein